MWQPSARSAIAGRKCRLPARPLQLMLRAKGDEFDRYFERCVEREGVFGFFGRKLGGGTGAAPPVRGVPFKSALSLVGRLGSLKKGAGGSVESRVARWFSESMKLAPAVASERLGISTALERPRSIRRAPHHRRRHRHPR